MENIVISYHQQVTLECGHTHTWAMRRRPVGLIGCDECGDKKKVVRYDSGAPTKTAVDGTETH